MHVLRELVGTSKPVICDQWRVRDDSDVGFRRRRNEHVFRYCIEKVHRFVQQLQSARQLNGGLPPDVIRPAQKQRRFVPIYLGPALDDVFDASSAREPPLKQDLIRPRAALVITLLLEGRSRGSTHHSAFGTEWMRARP